MHPYQEEGVRHIIKNDRCALFKEMGLGKTVTTLTAIKYLMYEELEIANVLVIAPKRVAENVWSDEIQEWEHLQGLTVSKIMGTPKERKAALRAKADIYLIGRDNVQWLCGLYGGSMLPFDMLVIDELSSFKNPSSLRFRALRKVQPCFKRIVGLTGTPSPNGLLDLWSQLYLLDRGERLGKFSGGYRQTYFEPGARNGHVVYKYNLKPGADKAIYRKIQDICLSMKASDYLKLPELVENQVNVYFPEDLMTKYKEFEKEMVLEMFRPGEDGADPVEVSAVNAAALSGKLLQFANGAVYSESKEWHKIHDLKIEAAKEIIEGANSPVLIGWTFRHDMYRLMEALKEYKPRELKTSQDIKDWNAGEVQVMMMHPASGGHGLNLQGGGNHLIWFGQTWSLELYQQFNARIHRQGQKKTTFLHRIVSKGTMDEDVIRAQARKNQDQSALMEAVKARIKKYL